MEQRRYTDLIRQLLTHYRYPAIALVTVLTLGIAGAVVLTTTSAGCGPANKIGLKTARCLNAGPVAHVGPYYPAPVKGVTPTPAPRQDVTPSQPPPNNPGASANPPYNPGASAYPPNQPAASANPPYVSPASFGAPPVPNTGSGSMPPGTALSCRLPVYAGGPGSGGFIVFPGQAFVADPRSAVAVPSPSPGTPTPPPQMGSYPGWYGLTYDAAYSKWLPAPYAWVSPDGVHYAYALGGEIYVQNVANGTQLELGQGRNFSVIGVQNDGVYVEQTNQQGLWFLPYSGSARQVATTYFWQAVSHGAAYGTPTSQVPSGASNTIDKLDLGTGTITPFFSQPSGVSHVTGFDLQDDPIIQVSYSQGQAIFIAGLQNYYPIAAMTYGGYYGSFPGGAPIADSHGIWYSTGDGVILYTGGRWYRVAQIGGQLAGQCT